MWLVFSRLFTRVDHKAKSTIKANSLRRVIFFPSCIPITTGETLSTPLIFNVPWFVISVVVKHHWKPPGGPQHFGPWDSARVSVDAAQTARTQGCGDLGRGRVPVMWEGWKKAGNASKVIMLIIRRAENGPLSAIYSACQSFSHLAYLLSQFKVVVLILAVHMSCGFCNNQMYSFIQHTFMKHLSHARHYMLLFCSC